MANHHQDINVDNWALVSASTVASSARLLASNACPMIGAAILTASLSQAGGPLHEAFRLIAIVIARGHEMYALLGRFAPAGDMDWIADRLLFKAHAREAQRMLAVATASAIAAQDALVLASTDEIRLFGDWVAIAIRHLDCALTSIDAARAADAASRVLARKARDLAMRLIQA